MDNFAAELKKQQQQFNKYSRPNLTPLQNKALRTIQKSNEFIIIEADKNMGSSIWIREPLLKQTLEEHLANEKVYLNITNQIQSRVHDLEWAYEHFIDRHRRNLPKNVRIYFTRAKKKYGERIAIFRVSAKVHKDPVMFRPIVAKCGTWIEAISKWLDCEFQKLAHLFPQCIKDSDSFRAEVITL